ncbi:hypothetical protein BpHYR1_002121 [Brachionus plicatilis]|uniref:Uncharacterized protein n=1 Tax=Brachionus plicatilis TaxID=10195 RepID=A0A3M7PJP0_BRAPC|nr:hypothetical protein BpHYR1_002121 [Brachionus plicatilis]
MKPTSQSIPSLMSVDFEPAAAVSSNHFVAIKVKNGLANGDLDDKKKSTFKVTFPDKLAIDRSSTQKKPHKSSLSNLFSKFDQERSLKSVKRKNLFGSRLEDNTSSDMPSPCTYIKNCDDLSKKFKKFHHLTKIDENVQHNHVTYGVEYLSKFNRYSITSSIIEKFDLKFKQITFSDDLINLPTISDSLCLSFKHNSNLVFQRTKNYQLNNLCDNKKKLITKNARLDECQHFFDSIDIDEILGAPSRAEPEILCSLIEQDVLYQHYMFKMVSLILNSLQNIYHLNLQQIKSLISNYQSRQMAEDLGSTRQVLLNNECSALSQKLNYLIEDYAKLNFDSTTETDGLVNLGAVIYKYLLNQLNQDLSKNEQKNFNYMREILDYYEVIHIYYEEFLIYDLYIQLISSIDEYQTSNLMTYLNDFKIILDDILSEFLLVGKIEAGIQSKIKFILQIQTAFVANDCNEILADPRKRNLKCCT